MTYDIIIIGGGTAGVIAAVQAGRAGANTLLVEKNGMPGGTMTVGGVNYPGLFHAESEQVIAGIGWELVTESVKKSGGSFPDFSKQKEPYGLDNKHWMYQIDINIADYACICDKAIKDAGVKLLYHSLLGELEWIEKENLWNASICRKTGLEKVQAKVVIDCSGDCNAVTIAGHDVESPSECQPATLVTKITGFEKDKLDRESIRKAFAEGIKKGDLLSGDAGWNDTGLAFLMKRSGNTIHIHSRDAATSEGRTELEIAGRESIGRLLAFFRKQKGLENLHCEFISSEAAARESCRIIGEKRITIDDYESGKIWDDSIAYSYYPIDLHTSSGLDKRMLKPGVRPTIPLGAMIPKDIPNFLAAGRHISGDQLAASAYRVQASCMAMGQAAAAAASLAVKENCDPRKVDLNKLKDMLKQHGAVVPE